MEAFAVMIIHIVRIALCIDNRGHKDFSGIALGGAYTGLVLASAPVSGACFNPARSLGPLYLLDQVASSSQFFMALAPFAGCTLAMGIYKKFLMSDDLEDELEEL